MNLALGLGSGSASDHIVALSSFPNFMGGRAF
jgi:hypothetical protein